MPPPPQQQQQQQQHESNSFGSGSNSSSGSSFGLPPLSSPTLYRYEAKRAGGVYEHIMRVLRVGNNSNTVSGIRDVQVHKSQTGQNTRVETELQPAGTIADLNINIVMDSDSNVSNVIDKTSIEYESLEHSVPSDDRPTSASLVGGGAMDAGGTGGGGGSPGGGSTGGGSTGGSLVGGTVSHDIVTDDSSNPEPQPNQEVDDESSESSESSDDEEDEEDDDEGEEGEEGDLDDAMRHFQRFLDGEKIDLLRGPGKDEDSRESRRKLPVGHLEKEGVVIGCMSVFSDVHIKEFIVFLSDEMVQAFLVDPGRFRSVASRTKCEIEVTRRILNRRMGRYRWLKYLIVIIRGPSYSSIDQCDKMMTVLFPPYRGRKPYGKPAVVSLFLRETTPDNTDLYYNFQRTGPSQRMWGEIPLRAPFRKTKCRPLDSTPWKMIQRRQQWGVLEPRNNRMETVMSHVYPERGGTLTTALDHSIKWAEAAEEAVHMSRAMDVAKAQMLKSRKMQSEPLYAKVFGE